jgi:hypothetical protein
MQWLDLTHGPGPEAHSLPPIPSTSLDADYLYAAVTSPAATPTLNPTYIHLAYRPARGHSTLSGTKIDARA